MYLPGARTKAGIVRDGMLGEFGRGLTAQFDIRDIAHVLYHLAGLGIRDLADEIDTIVCSAPPFLASTNSLPGILTEIGTK